MTLTVLFAFAWHDQRICFWNIRREADDLDKAGRNGWVLPELALDAVTTGDTQSCTRFIVFDGDFKKI